MNRIKVGLVVAGVAGGLSSIAVGVWPEEINWMLLPLDERTSSAFIWYSLGPVVGFLLALPLPAILAWVLARRWATGYMRSGVVAVVAIMLLNLSASALAGCVELLCDYRVSTNWMIVVRMLVLFAGGVLLTFGKTAEGGTERT